MSDKVDDAQNLPEFKFKDDVPKNYHDLLGPMFTPYAELLAKCLNSELDLKNHAFEKPLHVLVSVQYMHSY